MTMGRIFVQDYFKGHDYRPMDWGRFLTGLGRYFLALSLAPHEPPLWTGWVRPASRAAIRQQEYRRYVCRRSMHLAQPVSR